MRELGQLLFGGAEWRVRELQFGIGRVGEGCQWASPPKAGELWRVPRRAARAPRQMQAPIPNAGVVEARAVNTNRQQTLTHVAQSIVRRALCHRALISVHTAHLPRRIPSRCCLSGQMKESGARAHGLCQTRWIKMAFQYLEMKPTSGIEGE